MPFLRGILLNICSVAMRKILLLVAFGMVAVLGNSQILFDPSINVDFETDVILVPSSPLTTQVIFIGGYDQVETNGTYGNPAGSATSKEWNDFIGFTPDGTGTSLGWVSVNHERIVSNDSLGDGGGMTVFRVMRDANTDTLVVMSQTLQDGRSGQFFNVDFVNNTGETGMNCGGITSTVDGRIWTAEEWFRGSNADIADRDTSNFIIGTGTMMGQAAPAGFPGFNGDTIAKYQNYNYMTEIDPREAVAIRKQYNWGRQPFEGGVVMPDNQTVYLGADATPGFFTKFVANTAGDFTSGTTYVYKEDAPAKWVMVPNNDINNMLNFSEFAVLAGATMFNHLEWVAYDAASGNVYMTETGRDNPGSRFLNADTLGATHAMHTMARATAQGTHPDSADYWDYYGRVLQFDPTNDSVSVYLEAGPYFMSSPTLANYPDKHLSNPDGLNFMTINGQSYMLICEDLNGTSFGRTPDGISNRACELYMLDMSISNPQIDDLVRISVTPLGAEITGACPTPDGKTLLVNSQHPSTDNPFPYNYSLTYAITGWDQVASSMFEQHDFEGDKFQVWPNPATRELNLSERSDIAIYDNTGARVRVYRGVKQIDIQSFAKGIYYLRTEDGITKKLVIQ